MSIWFNDVFPLAYAHERGSHTLNNNLGIEITEAGEDVLKGRMPVDERTVNPAGVLHGGASIVFAETLASWASTFVVDSRTQQCVDLDINGNHLRPAVAGGMVYGEARPELLGGEEPCLERAHLRQGRQASMPVAGDHGHARQAQPVLRNQP